MIWPSLDCEMMEELTQEQGRLSLQTRLDATKSQDERNRLGQFATPTSLARDILRFGVALLGEKKPIRFLDPALGTGSFFSALLNTVAESHIEVAKGFELDTHYGEPAREFWRDTRLNLDLLDFTQTASPREEADRFNLVICNPPYVRHHHLMNEKPDSKLWPKPLAVSISLALRACTATFSVFHIPGCSGVELPGG
jgi:adenine-specific DNA-methyltransferase